MTGIYKITNIINGHAYIGQSVNIHRRWKAHFEGAFNVAAKVYNYPLSRAIRKYSKENFQCEILEICLVNELSEKEKYWINHFNTFAEGYNQGIGGTNGPTTQVGKEKISGIIFDLETTRLFHREIANKWNISTEMVQGINTGRYWKQDRIYPIQESLISKDGRKPKFCTDCQKEISSGATRCQQCSFINSRKVERPSREQLKNEIRNNSFLSLQRKYQISDNAIRKWCEAYGLPKLKGRIKSYSSQEWESI